MKRQFSSDDHDRKRQSKETRKQGMNESSSSTTSTSVKDILRCRIARKQAQQNKELASKAQDNSTLTSWASTLSSAGYFCEVRPIVDSDLFPLPSDPRCLLLPWSLNSLEICSFLQVPVHFSLLDF